MPKSVRMRRRDVAAPEPVKPKAEPEVVRLERVIERDRPIDLTEIERSMRSNEADIAEIKRMLASQPKPKPPQNYRFYPVRDSSQRITRVDAVVVGSDTDTLLSKAGRGPAAPQ